MKFVRLGNGGILNVDMIVRIEGKGLGGASNPYYRVRFVKSSDNAEKNFVDVQEEDHANIVRAMESRGGLL